MRYPRLESPERKSAGGHGGGLRRQRTLQPRHLFPALSSPLVITIDLALQHTLHCTLLVEDNIFTSSLLTTRSIYPSPTSKPPNRPNLAKPPPSSADPRSSPSALSPRTSLPGLLLNPDISPTCPTTHPTLPPAKPSKRSPKTN